MKKFLLRFGVILITLFAGYKILSGITKRAIDKTVTVTAPSSPKSQPEYYAFGYQPALTYSEDRQPCDRCRGVFE